MKDERVECVYKILLLGGSNTGKTDFLMRYTCNTCQKIHMATIGPDYKLKSMKLKSGKNIQLQIWDIPGQDHYLLITRNYFKASQGTILIYDITDKYSFEFMIKYINEIREEVLPQNIIIYIIANKIDMEDQRKVDKEEGKKLAEELGFHYMETSVKYGINLNKLLKI